MQITEMKINGVIEPIGYLTDYLSASWKVTETKSKKAEVSRIEVSDGEDFNNFFK